MDLTIFKVCRLGAVISTSVKRIKFGQIGSIRPKWVRLEQSGSKVSKWVKLEGDTFRLKIPDWNLALKISEKIRFLISGT